MTAETTKRRTLSARETAEKFNCSPRTVRRLIAEPRSAYLARAEERRKEVLRLRSRGLSYAEIAEAMETTPNAVGRLLHAARRTNLESNAIC